MSAIGEPKRVIEDEPDLIPVPDISIPIRMPMITEKAPMAIPVTILTVRG